MLPWGVPGWKNQGCHCHPSMGTGHTLQPSWVCCNGGIFSWIRTLICSNNLKNPTQKRKKNPKKLPNKIIFPQKHKRFPQPPPFSLRGVITTDVSIKIKRITANILYNLFILLSFLGKKYSHRVKVRAEPGVCTTPKIFCSVKIPLWKAEVRIFQGEGLV